METLNNYITERIIIAERIKIDNVKLETFPVNGTIDEIIEFLKSYGFTQMRDATSDNERRSKFNREYGRHFIVYRDHECIWFADTSNDKINRDNNIFSVDDSTNEYRSYFIWDDKNIDEVSKEKFLEAINKQFGF